MELLVELVFFSLLDILVSFFFSFLFLKKNILGFDFSSLSMLMLLQIAGRD